MPLYEYVYQPEPDVEIVVERRFKIGEAPPTIEIDGHVARKVEISRPAWRPDHIEATDLPSEKA